MTIAKILESMRATTGEQRQILKKQLGEELNKLTTLRCSSPNVYSSAPSKDEDREIKFQDITDINNLIEALATNTTITKIEIGPSAFNDTHYRSLATHFLNKIKTNTNITSLKLDLDIDENIAQILTQIFNAGKLENFYNASMGSMSATIFSSLTDSLCTNKTLKGLVLPSVSDKNVIDLVKIIENNHTLIHLLMNSIQTITPQVSQTLANAIEKNQTLELFHCGNWTDAQLKIQIDNKLHANEAAKRAARKAAREAAEREADAARKAAEAALVKQEAEIVAKIEAAMKERAAEEAAELEGVENAVSEITPSMDRMVIGDRLATFLRNMRNNPTERQKTILKTTIDKLNTLNLFIVSLMDSMDEDIALLSEVLKNNTTITQFSLSCIPPLSSTAFTNLTNSLCVNKTMKELILTKSLSGDENAINLSKIIKNNHTLTKLTISGLKEISPQAKTALLQAVDQNQTLEEFYWDLENDAEYEQVRNKLAQRKAIEKTVKVEKAAPERIVEITKQPSELADRAAVAAAQRAKEAAERAGVAEKQTEEVVTKLAEKVESEKQVKEQIEKQREEHAIIKGTQEEDRAKQLAENHEKQQAVKAIGSGQQQITEAATEQSGVLAEKTKDKEILKTHIINNILDKEPVPSSKEEKFERLKSAIKEIREFNSSYKLQSKNRVDTPQTLQECYNKASRFVLTDEEFNFVHDNLVAGEEDAIVQIFTQKSEISTPTVPRTAAETAAPTEPSETKPKVDEQQHPSETGLKIEPLTKDQEPGSRPTPRIPEVQVQPTTPPNPFKEKNIGQYVTEFLGTNSEELTSEQNDTLHNRMKTAKISDSYMERQKFIDMAVASAVRKIRQNARALLPKIDDLSKYLKEKTKTEKAGELQEYIDAKTGTPEKPIKLRYSTYYGLLSNEQEKLRIATDLKKNIQTASSAVEQFLMIRKAMLANKKATGPQFGKGKLDPILTKMSEDVLVAIKDPREKAVAELRAYILTIDAEKEGRLFSIGRTDLDRKRKIADDLLSLLIYRGQVGQLMDWGRLKPIGNISESYLNDKINENRLITHHTPGKGEGREDKILTDLFRGLFNKAPEIKPTKKMGK